MSALDEQGHMVAELMHGLGISTLTHPDDTPGLARAWVLSDADVVRLAQKAIQEVTALMQDSGAAPLDLQAAVTRNAWAVADGLHKSAAVVEGASLCPYPSTEPLSGVWTSAFASRVRWLKGGGVLQ